MSTPNEMTEAYDWRGRQIIGSDGEKIGTVDEIYMDRCAGDHPRRAALAC